MNVCPVFLTASDVDARVRFATPHIPKRKTKRSQTLNKAWILLQDFEFTEPDAPGSWVLLKSTTLPETCAPPKATRLLTKEDMDSKQDMAGFSVSDVSKFVRSNEVELTKLGISTYLWVIIDQKGVESSSCIFGSSKLDEERMYYTNEFEAVRVPMEKAWIMFVNLNIANMGFEDFADKDAGVQNDGLYNWIGSFMGDNKEVDAKREACLEKAKALGQI